MKHLFLLIILILCHPSFAERLIFSEIKLKQVAGTDKITVKTHVRGITD